MKEDRNSLIFFGGGGDNLLWGFLNIAGLPGHTALSLARAGHNYGYTELLCHRPMAFTQCSGTVMLEYKVIELDQRPERTRGPVRVCNMC